MTKTICTHSGKFHTDDIFAVALLLKKYPGSKVIRSREQTDFDSSDIVVDVGFIYDPNTMRFDHHQGVGAGERENGIKYSGFGLIWKHFGLEFCDNNQDVWQRIDETLVASIDANDNGQKLYEKNEYDTSPYTIDSMFNLFNPGFDEKLDSDAQFMQAVDIASVVLDRILLLTTASIKADQLLIDEYTKSEDKRYILLDIYIPMTKVTDEMPDLLYVMYPGQIKGWMIHCVNVPEQKFVSKKPLPEEWRGLPTADLRTISGVSDATFCHATGFIGGAESRDGIIAMLHKALEA